MRAETLIGSVKTALVGLVAYKSIQMFTGMIKETVDQISGFVDKSQQIGVAIEPLQQLGFVAEQSGSSMEGMTASLKKLARQAYEATKGGKSQAKNFKEMGIAFKDAHGKVRPAEDLLEDIADHFKSLPDGTEKTAKAMKVLGRSGADLIPMLNLGGDGIRELRDEFVELGGQVKESDAVAIEAFGDELEKLHVPIKGIKNQIVVALLPTMRKVVDMMIHWVKQPKNMQKIRDAVKKITDAIIYLGKQFFKMAEYVRKNWDRLTEVAKKFGKILLTVFAGKIIKTFGGLLMGVMSPVNMIILAVTALTKILAEAFDVDTLTAFEAMLAGIGAIITEAVSGYQQLWQLAKEIANLFSEDDAVDEAKAKQKLGGKTDEELDRYEAMGSDTARIEKRRRKRDTARKEKADKRLEEAGIRKTPAVGAYTVTRPEGAKTSVQVTAPVNLTINASDSKVVDVAKTEIKTFWDARVREFADAVGTK